MKSYKGFLYLGRGIHFPIALEGALKLKELAYMHAEGYPAGEMKHGPLALIDERMAVVVLAPKDELFEKTLSNLEEAKARGGQIISIGTGAQPRLEELSQFYLSLTGGELVHAAAARSVAAAAARLSRGRFCSVTMSINLAISRSRSRWSEVIALISSTAGFFLCRLVQPQP